MISKQMLVIRLAPALFVCFSAPISHSSDSLQSLSKEGHAEINSLTSNEKEENIFLNEPSGLESEVMAETSLLEPQTQNEGSSIESNSTEEIMPRRPQLLDKLLGGLDLKIKDQLSSINPEERNLQYKITFSLVTKNELDEVTTLEIFSTDEFSNPNTSNLLNKEIYIGSQHIFKALEPHLNLIEKSKKLKLEVSLNKIQTSPQSSTFQDADKLIKEILKKSSYEVHFRNSI